MLGGIAIGMSLLPEEFPLVLAVFMAMGAWRISQARVLTRRASAIEALGATTVLCTDKTGTLTENRMTIVSILSEDASWHQDGKTPVADKIQEILKAALFACPQRTHRSDGHGRTRARRNPDRPRQSQLRKTPG